MADALTFGVDYDEFDLAEAEHEYAMREEALREYELEDALQEATCEDYFLSELADEIAHFHCGMANEPQVFLAARNAAEDVLVSCPIRLNEEGKPYASEEDEVRAADAARSAGRKLIYRLLRQRVQRRVPAFSFTARALSVRPRATPRAVRTRRVARTTGSRGDPDPEPDRLTAAAPV